MAIRRTTVTVTGAAGGAGAATATANSGDIINGIIRAVHLAYTDSPPATTDVTIEGAQATPKIPVLTVSNANTDGWFYPMAQAQNQAAAAITNQGAPIPMDNYAQVTIAQANNGDGVTATIIWDDER